jgi:hypothetical protein
MSQLVHVGHPPLAGFKLLDAATVTSVEAAPEGTEAVAKESIPVRAARQMESFIVGDRESHLNFVWVV